MLTSLQMLHLPLKIPHYTQTYVGLQIHGRITQVVTHTSSSFKSSSTSLSPSKITGDTHVIGKDTKPKGNNGIQFEFSEPAVVQPVAAYVLEADSPPQYCDIEKDPECSEIYIVQMKYK